MMKRIQTTSGRIGLAQALALLVIVASACGTAASAAGVPDFGSLSDGKMERAAQRTSADGVADLGSLTDARMERATQRTSAEQDHGVTDARDYCPPDSICIAK